MTGSVKRVISSLASGVQAIVTRGTSKNNSISDKVGWIGPFRYLSRYHYLRMPHRGLNIVTSLGHLNLNSLRMHSEITKIDDGKLSITTIPATNDNFMYLIVDKATGDAAAVDPVEPQSLIEVAKSEKATIKVVLTTHHHWDHAGGNAKLADLYSKQNGNELEIFGGDSRVEALTKQVGQGDKIEVGNLHFDCIHTPCHTTGHICYYLKSYDPAVSPSVFTGDTLFVAGCGRFFEGTPPQMYEALIVKLGALPDNTRVFCGHEYTVNNLKFSLSVEPNNQDAKKKISWAEGQRVKRKPTVPSTIGEEKLFNPFMRVSVPSMQQATGSLDAVSCMGYLRTTKDNFKA